MLKRNGLVIGSVIVLIGLSLFLFSAWDIKVAHEAKRIGAYNNFDVVSVRAALARNPNDAAAHSSLAHIDITHSDSTGAAVELKQWARLEPENEEAKFLLAHALVRTGNRVEARQILQALSTRHDEWGRAAQRNLIKL